VIVYKDYYVPFSSDSEIINFKLNNTVKKQ